jgi:hypothetical protein
MELYSETNLEPTSETIVNIDDIPLITNSKTKIIKTRDISKSIKTIEIKNNSKKDLLLKIGLFNMRNYHSEPIGVTKLPMGKSYEYQNRFTTKLLQISVGIQSDDIGSKDVNVICHGLLVFNIFEIDDNYLPFKNITLNEFSYSYDGPMNTENSDKLICEPKTYYIINTSTKYMLISISLYDVIKKSTCGTGWIYLPCHTAYTFVNNFATKLFCITAGFPSKNSSKDCINIFCEDTPIFKEINEFDDSYQPYKNITYAIFNADYSKIECSDSGDD